MKVIILLLSIWFIVANCQGIGTKRRKRIALPIVNGNIIILLDGNKYVSISDWKCALKDAAAFVDELNSRNPIGPQGSNVGIITYDKHPCVNLKLKDGISLKIVKDKLSDLKLLGYANVRKVGLEKAYEIFKQSKDPRVPKVLLVYVHDPAEYGSTKEIADKIYAAGITVIVVAFGPNYDPVEALYLAGNTTSFVNKIVCPVPPVKPYRPYH